MRVRAAALPLAPLPPPSVLDAPMPAEGDGDTRAVLPLPKDGKLEEGGGKKKLAPHDAEAAPLLLPPAKLLVLGLLVSMPPDPPLPLLLDSLKSKPES